MICFWGICCFHSVWQTSAENPRAFENTDCNFYLWIKAEVCMLHFKSLWGPGIYGPDSEYFLELNPFVLSKWIIIRLGKPVVSWDWSSHFFLFSHCLVYVSSSFYPGHYGLSLYVSCLFSFCLFYALLFVFWPLFVVLLKSSSFLLFSCCSCFLFLCLIISPVCAVSSLSNP